MNKILKKKFLITFAFTLLFFIMGLLFTNLSDIVKNKKYSIKFSIDLDDKLLFYLDSSDTILIQNRIKDGREGHFTDIIRNYLNDNSVVKNTYLDFNQITVGEEFILIYSQSKDDIDSKIKKMIKEINIEVNEKVNNLLDIYIEMFQISETIKTKFVLSELEDVKKFKFELDKNQKAQSILEAIQKYKNDDTNYQIRILENLIDKYVKAVSGIGYTNLYGVLDKFYTEVSLQNIQILINRLEKNLKNIDSIDLNKLNENKEIISEIEFIKPGKVIKILDKSPNTFLILLLFVLTGIFLGIIYSFGILQLMNKKRLKSLLYQE